MTTLTDANMGTIMGKTSLTAPGTKCAIAYTSGTKDGSNYVIGTDYVFTVTTDEATGLGMITSVGEGTANTTWAQDGTSGRETSKTVTFTPTTAGPMSVHALCGGNAATPLYLATPLTGIVGGEPPEADGGSDEDGNNENTHDDGSGFNGLPECVKHCNINNGICPQDCDTSGCTAGMN